MSERRKYLFPRRLLVVVGVALLLTSVFATVALAGSSNLTGLKTDRLAIGPDGLTNPTISSGPTWNGAPTNTWTWTVTFDAITPPTNSICLLPIVDSVEQDIISCGATSPATCTLSTTNTPALANATTVEYVIAGYSGGGGCGTFNAAIPGGGTEASPIELNAGGNGFGPNAVALSSFDAARGDAGWQMAAIALLGLLGLGGGLWWARSRRQPLAG